MPVSTYQPPLRISSSVQDHADDTQAKCSSLHSKSITEFLSSNIATLAYIDVLIANTAQKINTAEAKGKRRLQITPQAVDVGNVTYSSSSS